MRIPASSRGAVCGATAALLLIATLAGCAAPPADPAERAAFEETNDPLELLNRQILDANLLIDRILLKPVTKVYIAILPEAGREALRHGLDNMKEPIVFINNVLQGEPERAGISLGRFTVNSTLGLGGLLDTASQWGLDKQSGDFGQTLFVWGLPEGPYLILPILGPSNPRDAVGMVVDANFDPFGFLATAKDLDEIQIARFVVDGIDQRARVIDVLDDLQKNALDFYAQLRSLARQRRAAELRHGAAPEPNLNFYLDPNQSAPASPQTGPSSPSLPSLAAAGPDRRRPPRGSARP